VIADFAPLHWEITIKDLALIVLAKLPYALTEWVNIQWQKEEEIAGTDTLNLGVAPAHGGNYRLFESVRHNDDFFSDSLTSF
jgi:hypothetical protein